MSKKILRRSDLCGRFHASYLVPDLDSGRGYLCYNCWKARQETLAPEKPASGEQSDETSKSQEPEE
jgi:hypothetical protein